MAAPASFRGAPQLQLQELQESLHETMQAILQGDGGNRTKQAPGKPGSALNKQLDSIEASIWQTFQSLPKKAGNGGSHRTLHPPLPFLDEFHQDAGHINSRSVRYLVHNYFAKEHGWLIKGLEPHGHQDNVSEVHEMTILQDKAPWLVESLLDRKDRGLSLSDTVAMIATLERLIFDEAHVLLQASYSLNSLKIEDEIDEQSLHEVLMSYLVLFEIGERAVLDNRALHRALKAKAARSDGNWPLLVEFEQDAVHNFNFALRHVRNPFRDSHLYSFQDAQAIIEDLTRGYGKWQNTECQQMKRELMDLDPHGMGRAPLGRFYSQPENAEYHFTETQDYLKKVGALEETMGDTYVRIANYMTGPSNCIASSSYYSVCCLNECEVLMNELESKILAPSASPERILPLASNLSSATVDAPRRLPAVMHEKLHAIAERHGGEVALHGRLFAQWMHYAFPNECPFPHIIEDVAVLAPGHWIDRKIAVSKAEREELAVLASQEVVEGPAETLAWSEEEVLATAPSSPGSSGSSGSNSLRFIMQVALLLGLGRTVLGSWRLTDISPGKLGKTDLPF
ncbi:unnamed protein product [Durusdinium trenchii]|uniref:Uncharacterized protein n=1 Tax=Durusdinium trenchii TaxID=1381693 RepID=A0ABP0KD49_9DINO